MDYDRKWPSLQRNKIKELKIKCINKSSLSMLDERNLKVIFQKLVPKFDPNNNNLSIFKMLLE